MVVVVAAVVVSQVGRVSGCTSGVYKENKTGNYGQRTESHRASHADETNKKRELFGKTCAPQYAG